VIGPKETSYFSASNPSTSLLILCFLHTALKRQFTANVTTSYPGILLDNCDHFHF